MLYQCGSSSKNQPSDIPTENDMAYVFATDMDDPNKDKPFSVVRISDLPDYMKKAKELYFALRFKDFKHKFPKDGRHFEYRLFAFCERGKSGTQEKLCYGITR
jgi:hypothetical protein